MLGRKYIDCVEISWVALEIWKAKLSDFKLNFIFLAADT